MRRLIPMWLRVPSYIIAMLTMLTLSHLSMEWLNGIAGFIVAFGAYLVLLVGYVVAISYLTLYWEGRDRDGHR